MNQPGTGLTAQQALLRMQRSRERLRGALLPAPEDIDPGTAARSSRAWPVQLWRWLARTPLAPAVKPAWRAASAWWRQHPWRPTTELVGSAVATELRPAIRQHPVMAIVLGAGLGAALVLARPWRWVPHAAGVSAAWQMALTGALAAWAERRADPVGPVRHDEPLRTDTAATTAGAQ
jgi:hypothetical protein